MSLRRGTVTVSVVPCCEQSCQPAKLLRLNFEVQDDSEDLLITKKDEHDGLISAVLLNVISIIWSWSGARTPED